MISLTYPCICGNIRCESRVAGSSPPSTLSFQASALLLCVRDWGQSSDESGRRTAIANAGEYMFTTILERYSARSHAWTCSRALGILFLCLLAPALRAEVISGTVQDPS